MRQFSQLYSRIDSTTSTNAKVQHMCAYFEMADAEDSAWAAYFLSGQRIKRLVSASLMREWLTEVSAMPEWLVKECYTAVGDLAETISLLMQNERSDTPTAQIEDISLAEWMNQHILPLKDASAKEQKAQVTHWWRHLDIDSNFLVNKLLTGALRVGVSRLLVARAISVFADIPKSVVLHRLMGKWQPSADFFKRLVDPDTRSEDISQPYPFFLASPLQDQPQELGAVEQWQAEWKWDGIRAQLVKREDELFLWSRGEELIGERFPEIIEAAEGLPNGLVLDGEILAWNDAGVMPFSQLQKRIGRKTVSKKLRADVPTKFLAYDLMEYDNKDVREWRMQKRRAQLETVLQSYASSNHLGISSVLESNSWKDLAAQREQSRQMGVEGLMLKNKDSIYQAGRKRGDWWKWKVEPYTVDAVMIYAQAGHGRRANLFTDYTFAVWSEGNLLPIAKAYSGLTDKEILRVDRWVRKNTKDKFGPVRAVKPELVFEIAFENISLSKRHKSGVAVRFPRILRWREDLRPDQADNLNQLHELLKVEHETV